MRKFVLMIAVVGVSLVGLSCRISPVITAPDDGGGHQMYDDCRRAAKDYCRDVIGASKEDMKACVSQSTFECLSGRSGRS